MKCIYQKLPLNTSAPYLQMNMYNRSYIYSSPCPTYPSVTTDGGGPHFRVAHLTLAVFVMMQRFEHVCTEAKHYYNLGIHEILPLVVGILQLYLNLMDFCQFSSQGSNLGYMRKPNSARLYCRWFS
jgi:hypothetical protein